MSVLDNLKLFLVDVTPAMAFPVITCVFLLFFFIYYIRAVLPQRGTAEWIKTEVDPPSLTFLSRCQPMERKDAAPLVIIVSLFFILAVLNLGSMSKVDVTGEIRSPSENQTHTSSMYFDEIYFVRTAVEHLENTDPYEVTHPPLGKEIIAASILTFGMSPFGWRIFGALFGVMMLAVMYIFIKNLFGRTAVAVCGTLLFGFDFMRFVQTRMATVDTYAVPFILLAFFFMYRHITTNVEAPLRKSLVPLALSGFFFGLSIATKWIGFYAGAGLLIIYVIRLFQLGSYYNSTGKDGFGLYLTKTLLFSILFFVIVPALVYYLAYIPYGLARGLTLGGGMLWDVRFFELVWGNQVYMFSYHYNLAAEHPFSSVWWQWIFNIRPVLYVNNIYGDTRATFGAFGNPVVWWGGFLAMLMMAVRIFTHRDGKALFILIGYLTQLLPWIAVSRIVFAYHYFPSTLFLVLALTHVFNTILERRERSGRSAVYAYTAVSGTIFAVFYPALSGLYLPVWYYSDILRWFRAWPF